MIEEEDIAPQIGSPASNDVVRANLAQHGDDGTAPRDVEHFCYPDPSVEGAASQDEVVLVFQKKGFLVELLAGEGDDEPDWLQMKHHSEGASVGFDLVTEWFLLRLNSLGWIYDGWSCSVVPGPDAQAE
jgi:hypothetical protein